MSAGHMFGRLFQLGYVVTDIERVADNLRARYGISSWKVVPLDPDAPATRIAMAMLGDTVFELVEVNPAMELMPMHRDWLPASPGEARFNHLAYLVDSLDDWHAAQAHFRAIDVEIPVSMSFGDAFEFFYADTVAEFGHWSEFVCLGPAGREFLADIPRF